MKGLGCVCRDLTADGMTQRISKAAASSQNHLAAKASGFHVVTGLSYPVFLGKRESLEQVHVGQQKR